MTACHCCLEWISERIFLEDHSVPLGLGKSGQDLPVRRALCVLWN